MTHFRILVVGSGNFGTCLANHLAKKGESVTILSRNSDVSDFIIRNRMNPHYLKGVQLSDRLHALSLSESPNIDGFNMVVLTTPTQFLRQTLCTLGPKINRSAIVVCASKGIEMTTLQFPSAIVKELAKQITEENIAVLSGPSFAVEIANEEPTSVSIASTDLTSAQKAQGVFHSGSFRAYTSQDPVGLEVAGALKNVVALASGAAKSLGMQNNALASLLTRGLAEITRVGVALGANPATFAGLGGVGDLFLTCTSEKSRNFSVGYQVGKGKTLEQIIENLGSVAEGISTTKSAYNLARKLDIDTPIIDTVYNVLYEKKPLHSAVANLFSREMKAEITYP